jgi:hypothetical protein
MEKGQRRRGKAAVLRRMGVKLFDPQMLNHQPEYTEVRLQSEEALPLEKFVVQLEKRYN